MQYRTLSDSEVLVRANAMADDRSLPLTAQQMIAELAWRLDRQVGQGRDTDDRGPRDSAALRTDVRC